MIGGTTWLFLQMAGPVLGQIWGILGCSAILRVPHFWKLGNWGLRQKGANFLGVDMRLKCLGLQGHTSTPAA